MDHFERDQPKRQERHGVIVAVMRSTASCFKEKVDESWMGHAAGVSRGLHQEAVSSDSCNNKKSPGEQNSRPQTYLVLTSNEHTLSTNREYNRGICYCLLRNICRRFILPFFFPYWTSIPWVQSWYMLLRSACPWLWFKSWRFLSELPTKVWQTKPYKNPELIYQPSSIFRLTPCRM